MDAATLAAAMGCSRAVADRYVADMNAAMLMAGCTTVNRAAMWCAQVGHESVGLQYMEEIASGDAYEGRKDLGNTRPGDGRRFKGRGPIQLTGRLGYTQFLQWCRDRRLDPPDFLAHPEQVATGRWGFLAAAHYWTVRRPKLNAASDAGNVLLASQMINGYVARPNGLTDRQNRWDRCRRLGNALLPPGPESRPVVPPPPVRPPVHILQGEDY